MASKKLHKRLHTQLDSFLAERKKAGIVGHWPPVTDEDQVAAYKLFYAILNAKYERDDSNDMPVTVRLRDHTRHRPSHYCDVPHDFKPDADHSLILDLLVSNVQIAMGELDTFLKIAGHYKRVAEKYVKDKATADEASRNPIRLPEQKGKTP